MTKQISLLRLGLTVITSVAFVATWSSGFLVPAIVSDVSALTLLVWRFVPLAVGLIAIVLITGAARGVTRVEIGRQVLIGVFAQFGYCAAVYASIAAGVATGTTALIDAVQPLVVAMLVGPLLGLRVQGAQWAGLVLGAVGVLLVVRSQLGGSDAPPQAYLLPVLAMACLIVGTFLQRRSAVRTGVLLTLAVQVAVTAAALVLLAAFAGALVPPASVHFWVAVAFSAAFPTLAAYGLYWWLLRRIGITALNALLFLVAPATAAAGALVLGERLTVVTLIGFVMCGVGVGVVLASESRVGAHRDHREAPRARRAHPAGPVRPVNPGGPASRVSTGLPSRATTPDGSSRGRTAQPGR